MNNRIIGSLLVASAIVGASFASTTDTIKATKEAKTQGNVWLISTLAYELPSDSLTSTEFGYGWYGFGVGINQYTQSDRLGTSYAVHVGVQGKGVAINGQYNYNGEFSKTLLWRAGIGIEHFTGSRIFGVKAATFPYIELSLGIKL